MPANTKASRTTTTRSGSHGGVPILISTASVCSLITLVICTAALDAHTAQRERSEDQSEEKYAALPAICEQYYNDGTGRWAECMGVGRK